MVLWRSLDGLELVWTLQSRAIVIRFNKLDLPTQCISLIAFHVHNLSMQILLNLCLFWWFHAYSMPLWTKILSFLSRFLVSRFLLTISDFQNVKHVVPDLSLTGCGRSHIAYLRSANHPTCLRGCFLNSSNIHKHTAGESVCTLPGYSIFLDMFPPTKHYESLSFDISYWIFPQIISLFLMTVVDLLICLGHPMTILPWYSWLYVKTPNLSAPSYFYTTSGLYKIYSYYLH